MLQTKEILSDLLRVVVPITFLLSCGPNTNSRSIPAQEEVAAESVDAGNAVYTDLEGNSIRVSDFKGKRVLLHFWATWCKPCLEELPALERARPALEKENYQLLLISEEELDDIQRFQEKSNFEFPFVRYEGALSELKIYALPATFIYNENGEKVNEFSGRMDWDAEQTIKQVINLP